MRTGFLKGWAAGFLLILAFLGISFGISGSRSQAAGLRKPVYRETWCEGSQQKYSQSRQQYTSDWDVAVAELRDGMIDRQNRIRIAYRIAGPIDEDMPGDMFEDAMSEEYALSPNSGDYLKWNWDTCDTGISAYTDSATGETCLEITYDINYYTTGAQEEEFQQRAGEVLDELELENKNEYEIVESIYDYITANVEYDREHVYDDDYLLQYTAYAALFHNTAVCQGYANLFYYLCKECGVSARLIPGMGGGEPHAWNIARINGVYYNADSTWDAELGKGRYLYFLRSEQNFSRNHIRDEEYRTEAFYASYPMSGTDWKEQEETGDIPCPTRMPQATDTDPAATQTPDIQFEPNPTWPAAGTETPPGPTEDGPAATGAVIDTPSPASPTVISTVIPPAAPTAVFTVIPPAVPTVVPPAAPTAASSAGKSVDEPGISDGIKKGTMTYQRLNSGEVELIRDSSKKSSVTIPSTVKDGKGKKYKVVSIGGEVYQKKKKLKKVTVEKNVRSIKSRAFYGCKKLKTVRIKSRKFTAGSKAFKKTGGTVTYYLQKKSLKNVIRKVSTPHSRFKIK